MPRIEPHRGAAHALQEAPVVADQDDGRRRPFQLAFQPFDGRQVEMVGRLVEKQDVGRRRKHAGESRTSRPPRRTVAPGVPRR